MKSFLPLRIANVAIVGVCLFVMCAALHAHSFIPEENTLHRDAVLLSRVGDTPQTIYPASSEIVNCPGATLKLRWHEVPGISNYFVEVASDAAMANTILKTMTQFDTTISCPLTKTQSTYYWRISTGVTTSDVSMFSLRYATSVQLVDKYNGATIASNLVPFRWSSDPAASSYNVEIMSPSVEVHTTSTTDTTVTLTLVRQELVRWRVQPVCASGAGSWTERDSVIVAAEINDVSYPTDNLNVRVFPHPVQSMASIVVTASYDASASLIVSDALGQSIDIPVSMINDRWLLDCNSCPNGLYFVTLQSATSRSTVSFLVNH